MKILKFSLDKNNVFKAEKVIKTNNKITGYNGKSIVFEFDGVSDFNLFTLTDEEGNFIPYDLNTNGDGISETLNMNDLKMQNNILQQQIQTLSETLAQLMLDGGTPNV